MVLIQELIASRRQVDRLLDHQQQLLSMLVASHPALQPLPQQANFAQQTLPALLAQPPAAHQQAPPAAQPSYQAAPSAGSLNGRPPPGAAGTAPVQPSTPSKAPPPSIVTQLLGNLGAVQGSQGAPSDSLSGASILEALDLAQTGDVLADVNLNGTAATAAAAPAEPRTPAAPAAPPKEEEEPPAVPLPELEPGARNAWWMERLHVALLARGYYSGDDDVQSWTFGEGTKDALTSFQADFRLPVTGLSDAATWTLLLSELPEFRRDLFKEVASGKAPVWPPGSERQLPPKPAAAAPVAASAPVKKPAPAAPAAKPAAAPPPPVAPPAERTPAPSQVAPITAFFSTSAPAGQLEINPSFVAFEGEEDPMDFDPRAFYASQQEGSGVPVKAAVDSRPPTMEHGDLGGFFMENLHAALLRAGFDPSFREVDRGKFGDETLEAVKGFQSMRQLPVTGLVDEATWAMLLKDEADLRQEFVSAVVLGSASASAALQQAQTGHSQSNGNGAGPHATAVTAPSVASSSEGGTSSAAQASAPVETAVLLPPALCLGSALPEDDHIVWISRLHRVLVSNGFYPPDEEVEDLDFGSGTHEAVMYAQASAGVPETGVVCPDTWRWLLRDVEHEVACEVRAALGGEAWAGWYAAPGGDQGARAVPAPSTSSSAADERALTASLEALEARNVAASSIRVAAANSARDNAAVAAHNASEAASPVWPVVMDGDGGQAVAVLQRALAVAGYHCGEDEPRWWQAGSETINALRTFQACNGLAETGVCDAAAWLSLMRAVKAEGSTLEELRAHLQSLPSEDEENYSSDISTEQQAGRVWLIGEQRWEQRGSKSTVDA